MPIKLLSEMVSSDSPLGEDRTSAQEPRQAEGGEVPYPTLALSLSQIVVTFFSPSPSRRPLLVFAELTTHFPPFSLRFCGKPHCPPSNWAIPG